MDNKRLTAILNALAVFAFFTWLFEGIYKGRVLLGMDTFSTRFPGFWNWLVTWGYWVVFIILLILGIYMTAMLLISLYQWFKKEALPFLKNRFGKGYQK